MLTLLRTLFRIGLVTLIVDSGCLLFLNQEDPGFVIALLTLGMLIVFLSFCFVAIRFFHGLEEKKSRASFSDPTA